MPSPSFPTEKDRRAIEAAWNSTREGKRAQLPTGLGCPVFTIPLRGKPGELPPLNPEDVILGDGDVVFIEARDIEVFYAGGLLPPGEYVLPRDRDLNVVEAVSFVNGPLFSSGISVDNLTGRLIPRGVGFPSPSMLSVIRQVPGHGQIVIRVDLDRAVCDPRESIIVRPKDVLVLQETPTQALARYFLETVTFELFFELFRTSSSFGNVTATSPERLFNR